MTMSRPVHLVLTSEVGYDRLRPAIGSGALAHLRRGAHLRPLEHGDEDEAQRVMLLARCHAVASTLTCRYAFGFRTAAALYGWPVPSSAYVDVVQTGHAPQRRSRDVIRHRTLALPDEDIVEIDGLPIVVPARTAIDCALAFGPALGLAVVDAALRDLAAVSRFHREESVARQDPIREWLAQLLVERGSARHVKRARAVVAHSDGFSESGPESWMRWLALSRGMPVPQLQLPILTRRSLRYPDALWAFDGARPVLAEYDGTGKYGKDAEDAGEALIEEKDREQLLRQATRGEFVRFTKIDQRDPDGAFQRLLDACPISASDLEPRLDLMPTWRRGRA